MRIVRLVLCDWGRHLVPPSQATRVIIDGEIVSHICHKCRKREQEGFKISLQELKDPGSEKQITQSVKNEVDLPPIEGGGLLLRTQIQWNTAKRLLFTRKTPLKEPKEDLRTATVAKLLAAIEESNRLAKSSSPEPTEESGGVSMKERYYRLMAYLAQTLEAFLRGADTDQLKEIASQTDEMIDELKLEVAKAKTRAREAPRTGKTAKRDSSSG